MASGAAFLKKALDFDRPWLGDLVAVVHEKLAGQRLVRQGLRQREIIVVVSGFVGVGASPGNHRQAFSLALLIHRFFRRFLDSLVLGFAAALLCSILHFGFSPTWPKNTRTASSGLGSISPGEACWKCSCTRADT